MGIQRAEHTLAIDAPPAVCFEALTDYESFPEWQAAVRGIEVLDRHADGLGRDVRVHVDAKLREFTYTLRYSYERPTRIRWDYVEGDVEHVDGEFRLDPIDGGHATRATYILAIDPGFPAPALLVRRLNSAVMRRSVEDLKREAERRVSPG